jgi:hypothetical protein
MASQGNDTVERRHDAAPFRSGVGICNAATERTAGTDRVVGDVLDDFAQKRACHTRQRLTFESGMSNARANIGNVAFCLQRRQFNNAINIDEVGGLRDPESHRRD